MRSASTKRGTVLLTGATGFIGSHVYPMLRKQGYEVRCTSRSPQRAQQRWPERTWVQMDVERPETIERAMSGCDSAIYLIHQMSDGKDYEQREARSAMAFADAAAVAQLKRIVYLGGVKTPDPSTHLRSRLVTGAILRGGQVPAVELRASMVIGPGSASWQILRDIAVRLPVMLFPKWLRNRTQPVALDDVSAAIVGALEMLVEHSVCFDLPGPEVLSFQECILRVGELVGNKPYKIQVPFLTPHLSSYWLRLVTGSNYHLSQELVEGLRGDLLARDGDFWSLIGHENLLSFDEAARRALAQTPVPANRAERVIRTFYRSEPAMLRD